MHRMAVKYAATWASTLKDRRVPSSIALASTALRLIRRDWTSPMSKGMGEFVFTPVPAFVAGLPRMRFFFIV
jgi:hypothetical protein